MQKLISTPNRPEGHPSASSALRLALLGFLLWIPLPAASNWPWASALMVCLLAILGLWRAWTLTGAWPHSGMALPGTALLALTALWLTAQWLLELSTDPGETFRHSLLTTSYALLYWLTIDLFSQRRHLNLLLTTLVLSGTLQAFYGTFMTLSGIEWLLTGPKEHGLGVATGTFVNRNHLAGYLEMTAACGIGLMLALRDGKPFNWHNLLELLVSAKLRLRLCIVIMVIALVVTQSRMGNTAFFTSLLLMGGLFVMANKRHRLRNGLILASLLVIDLAVISQYFGLENLKNRLVQTQLEDRIEDGAVVRAENVDRDDVTRYGLAQFSERPLTGFGGGSFEASFPSYAGADIRADFDHAHNDLLQFPLEFGLIGALPLLLLVALSLYHALIALWHPHSAYRNGVGFGAAMGIVALLIHASADFNHQIPANAATFVVLCAIAVLARHHRNDKARLGRVPEGRGHHPGETDMLEHQQ